MLRFAVLWLTAAGIHALLHELNQSLGQTIVVVTHEPAMADAARRVLHMNDGVIADGEVVEA